MNRLDTGNCHLNRSPVNDEPDVPFGGLKASGTGKHGGRWSMETFTERRWMTIDRGGRSFPPVFWDGCFAAFSKPAPATVPALQRENSYFDLEMIADGVED